MIKQDEQAFRYVSFALCLRACFPSPSNHAEDACQYLNSTEYATKMFKEERRLAAALERERAASKAEARKTQVVVNAL